MFIVREVPRCDLSVVVLMLPRSSFVTDDVLRVLKPDFSWPLLRSKGAPALVGDI